MNMSCINNGQQSEVPIRSKPWAEVDLPHLPLPPLCSLLHPPSAAVLLSSLPCCTALCPAPALFIYILEALCCIAMHCTHKAQKHIHAVLHSSLHWTILLFLSCCNCEPTKVLHRPSTLLTLCCFSTRLYGTRMATWAFPFLSSKIPLA